MSSKRKKTSSLRQQDYMASEDRELFEASWEVARAYHGNNFTFYLPGMIRYGQQRGRYPAISITGDHCELQCEHCKGRLLEPMIKAIDPAKLFMICEKLFRMGAHGILLTGGSDSEGRLPWETYLEAIYKIKKETSLFISAHTGFPKLESCLLLKDAGVDQAIIDVMGDEETASHVYHLDGLEQVYDALNGIRESALEFAPHVVAGLFYGKIRAEYKALEIIRRYQPEVLVFVVLTPLKGTPMARVAPPSPLEIGRLIARARLLMPEVPISLGCERPRNRQGRLMERLSILAGANRMAVWSEAAVEEAKNLGLTPRFLATCCSLNYNTQFSAYVPV